MDNRRKDVLYERYCIVDFKSIIRRHGITLLLAALLLTGLVLGAVYSKSADKNTLRTLDFLFTTNLESRLSQGAFGTFCACFASDFLFLLSVYLLGIAAWGIPFIAVLLCFKGFGTGVTAGWLCVSHGLSGAGFYLLVLLPGTFIFCAVLIGFSARAFAFSKHAFFRVLKACFLIFAEQENPRGFSQRGSAPVFVAVFFSTRRYIYCRACRHSIVDAFCGDV